MDFFNQGNNITGYNLGKVVEGGLKVFSNIFGGKSQRDAVETPQVTNITNTMETNMSGEENLDRGFQGASFFPAVSALPSIVGTGSRILKKILPTVTGVAGGAALTQLGGSGEICAPASAAPYSVNKTSGCISVTRKQQARLKEIVSLIGIEQAAQMVDLDTQTLVLLLLKRFKARGRGITAASMRTTKRTIRQIKGLHNEVSSMAGRRAPVRRAAAVKQVKYSN
jgi:hypothetical protein